MTAGTGHGVFSSRNGSIAVALVALATAFAVALPSASHAQEQQERPGLLNRLFGKPAYRVEDPPANVGKPPKAARSKAERTEKKKKPRVQREGVEPPPVAVITKRPDARVVLVIGDFLGSGLAEGLTTAFTQNSNVRIVDRTSGSSGFVREDFHNWPERVDELITAENPAAIVVMIGANDRQQMLVDGAREEVRSANWNREYAERAGDLAKAIAARKVPFLWVGMPPFKSSKMMLDMLAFNDTYRATAASAGGEYVDIWDGFVDENGVYVSNGPDVNGQPARLRANDGINLARPGKRKVAFYAEKPLYKVLGEDPAAPSAEAAALAARPAYRLFGPFGPSEPQEPADLDVIVDPNEVGPIDPARPVALRTPALDGGTELLGMVAEPRLEVRTPAERLVIEGIAPTPPAGRADQFAWPQLASAAAAMGQVNIDRTLNKAAAPSMPQGPAEDRAASRAVRSNVLTEPSPPIPPRVPPEIRQDRLEEISPAQAAPAVSAAEPPTTTPATFGKTSVPDLAKGDPLDLSPARGAPQQAYKRPKSIGPEPNRAPTAVPQPAPEIFAPAEAEPEIPSASAGESAPEPAAEKTPALPDTAPARAPAPSTVPGIADDTAPARGAPRAIAPIPVAALPAKEAPSELVPAPEAPSLAAPNTPVEPAADLSVAKAAPSGPDDIGGSAPAKTAPSAEPSTPGQAPVRIAPSALPAVIDIAPSRAPADSAGTAQPAGPVTPAPQPPPAPAAPSVLPENASKPTPRVVTPEKAEVGVPPAAQPISADGASSIRVLPSVSTGTVAP